MDYLSQNHLCNLPRVCCLRHSKGNEYHIYHSLTKNQLFVKRYTIYSVFMNYILLDFLQYFYICHVVMPPYFPELLSSQQKAERTQEELGKADPCVHRDDFC